MQTSSSNLFAFISTCVLEEKMRSGFDAIRRVAASAAANSPTPFGNGKFSAKAGTMCVDKLLWRFFTITFWTKTLVTIHAQLLVDLTLLNTAYLLLSNVPCHNLTEI